MDFSIDEKLKLASEMCDGNYMNTHNFSRIYPFTTENISAYLPLFDFVDKSLLTVCSSGDQALNAILCGSKDITVFDICPFAKEYFYLKKAAIETLTIQEFLRFFCYKDYPVTFFDNKNAFDIRIYMKLRDALKNDSEETEYFWSELFKKYSSIRVRNSLFSFDENKYKLIKLMNNYLKNDDAYNKLRDKFNAADIKFISGDIFNDNIDGSFDNVFLSNLGSYYNLVEIRNLFDKILVNLNDDGRMMIAYLYETDLLSDDYMEGEAEIYNIPKVLKMFPKDIVFDSFIGVRGLLFKSNRIRDNVITYKKVKKI